MGELSTRGKVREQSMSVVVIRADGTREDHGVVSYWHRNPLRRWAFALRRMLKER